MTSYYITYGWLIFTKARESCRLLINLMPHVSCKTQYFDYNLSTSWNALLYENLLWSRVALYAKLLALRIEYQIKRLISTWDFWYYTFYLILNAPFQCKNFNLACIILRRATNFDVNLSALCIVYHAKRLIVLTHNFIFTYIRIVGSDQIVKNYSKKEF